MKRYSIVACAMAAAALLAGGAAARAQDAGGTNDTESADQERGDAVVMLGGGVSFLGTYHSNPYYREQASEAEAWLWSVDPSLRCDIPVNELLFIGADARVKVTQFMFRDDAEEDKTIVNPYIQGRVRYNLSEATSLALVDDYQRANVEDVGDKPRFTLNNAQLSAAHDFGGEVLSRIWYRNTVVDQTGGALLFDSMENAGGLSADWMLNRTASGRATVVGAQGTAGRKAFDEGRFYLQSSDENPKTHDFYSVGLNVTHPISSLVTLHLRGGVTRRDYASSSPVRDGTTDSPYGGVTVAWVPSRGSPLSLTAATSYEVADTVIYNIPVQDQAVFETTDALLNNLNIAYRELEVWRTGLTADYTLRRLLLGLSLSYQKQQADGNEDLGPISGNVDPAETGVGRPIDQDQFMVSATARYRFTESFSLGVGFQYGVASDGERPGDEDLYDYQSVGVLGKLEL